MSGGGGGGGGMDNSGASRNDDGSAQAGGVSGAPQNMANDIEVIVRAAFVQVQTLSSES
jgi:hypothetical protein